MGRGPKEQAPVQSTVGFGQACGSSWPRTGEEEGWERHCSSSLCFRTQPTRLPSTPSTSAQAPSLPGKPGRAPHPLPYLPRPRPTPPSCSGQHNPAHPPGPLSHAPALFPHDPTPLPHDPALSPTPPPARARKQEGARGGGGGAGRKRRKRRRVRRLSRAPAGPLASRPAPAGQETWGRPEDRPAHLAGGPGRLTTEPQLSQLGHVGRRRDFTEPGCAPPAQGPRGRCPTSGRPTSPQRSLARPAPRP